MKKVEKEFESLVGKIQTASSRAARRVRRTATGY